MKSLPITLLAIVSGLVVLLGIFFPTSIFALLQISALQLVVILAAFASLIAIANLVMVHWNKIFADPRQGIYSAVLLVGFLCVVFVGIVFSPANKFFTLLSSTVIFTVESSLLALLCLSLAIACFKLFQKRRNTMAIIFGISTIIFLLTLSGFFTTESQFTWLKPILAFINILPLAGARGILLGISIGAIVTGLRVLIGADRPYSG